VCPRNFRQRVFGYCNALSDATSTSPWTSKTHLGFYESMVAPGSSCRQKRAEEEGQAANTDASSKNRSCTLDCTEPSLPARWTPINVGLWLIMALPP